MSKSVNDVAELKAQLTQVSSERDLLENAINIEISSWFEHGSSGYETHRMAELHATLKLIEANREEKFE